MPILEVSALPQKNSKNIKTALKNTCCAIAQVYGCEESQVWGIWNEIKPGFYVEGDAEGELQPLNTHPPVARLTCFEGQNPDNIERLLLTTATTLSKELGIPNNIFVKYDEARSGKVIAGNGVIRKKVTV